MSFAKRMENQKKINDMYRGILHEKGQLHQSDISNRLRYLSLLKHPELFQGKSVLDVGCGLGAFAWELRDHGIKPSYYQGIDPLDEAAYAADASMDVNEGDPLPWETHFDYVKEYLMYVPDRKFNTLICIGVFDVKLDDDHYGMVSKMVENMFKQVDDECGVVACTFLSTFWKPIGLEKLPEHAGPVNPAAAINLFKIHAPRVLLDHTYAPHIFTMIGQKGLTPWEQLDRDTPKTKETEESDNT